MTATEKICELDVVELTTDLPDYGIRKGERATVIAVFDAPDEAYDLELVDALGQSRFAYSVKPAQIRAAAEAAKTAF